MVSVCVWEHSPVDSRVKHSYIEKWSSASDDNALVFVTLLLRQIFRYFYLQVVYVSHKMHYSSDSYDSPIKLPGPLSHRLVTSTKDPAAATLALCLPLTSPSFVRLRDFILSGCLPMLAWLAASIIQASAQMSPSHRPLLWSPSYAAVPTQSATLHHFAPFFFLVLITTCVSILYTFVYLLVCYAYHIIIQVLWGQELFLSWLFITVSSVPGTAPGTE